MTGTDHQGSAPLDEIAPAETHGTSTAYEGRIFRVERDRVHLPGAQGAVERDVVRHPGAVIVVALRDGEGGPEILLIRQYRHAVGSYLWELPAGLLDVAGEQPATAAARELAEEADLAADRWDVLLDTYSSPGMTDEAVRFFLARDTRPLPDDQRSERTDEEAGIVSRWIPLDEARDAVLGGRIHNSACVIGILAAQAAYAGGLRTLRPDDTPWPEHPANRS